MTTAPLILEPEALPDRRPLDKYRTPAWVTAALIESFPELRGDLLIDPCAGDCRMPKQLLDAKRFDRAITNDLDETEPTDLHVDACAPTLYRGANQQTTWIVSNPPFLEATRIAWNALQQFVRGGLALLLRATWLEPAKDRRWLGGFPPKAILVLPRVSFIGGGSDQAGCHWLLWGDVEPSIKVYTGKPGQQELLR